MPAHSGQLFIDIDYESYFNKEKEDCKPIIKRAD